MARLGIDRAPTGRMAEAVLLVIAYALGIGSYGSTLLTMEGQLPPNFATQAIGLLIVCVVAAVLVRAFAPHADPVLLPTAIALNGLGLAMIYRLDIAYRTLGRPADASTKQLIFTVVGVGLMALTLFFLRDHRKLRHVTYTAMVFGIVLLILPEIPGIGKEINGARIWIRIIGFNFQPSELAKLCFAIFFAGYLVMRRDSLALGGPKILGMRLPRLRDLGPIVVVWLVSLAVLVMQHDLGTSLMLFGLFVAMLYVATNQVSWLVIGAILFVPSAFAASKIFAHVGSRFDVWLHAFDQEIYSRSFGGSWQLVQGLFGMANGGLLGTGWGNGYPNLVSMANSDFIFASFAEELGLTGALAILLLYLIFIERGMRQAIAVRDGFGKLLAAGLSFTIAMQVFVVVGGVTRVIPLTGLTLPFAAAGGSSLVVNWIILALLLRISDSARRPVPAGGAVSTTEINEIIDREARKRAEENRGPRLRHPLANRPHVSVHESAGEDETPTPTPTNDTDHESETAHDDSAEDFARSRGVIDEDIDDREEED